VLLCDGHGAVTDKGVSMMKQSTMVVDGIRLPLYSVNTLIVGSGAAAR